MHLHSFLVMINDGMSGKMTQHQISNGRIEKTVKPTYASVILPPTPSNKIMDVSSSLEYAVEALIKANDVEMCVW